MADAKFFSTYERGDLRGYVLTVTSPPCALLSPVVVPTVVNVLQLLFIARGKTQELRQELQAADKKDKGFVRKKTVLKKIVANMTMGNDSKPLLRSRGGF